MALAPSFDPALKSKRVEDGAVRSADLYGVREVIAPALDGATLDRFAFIVWEVDEDFELHVAGDDQGEWVRFVQKCRKAATACGVAENVVFATPRASINGAKALRQGSLSRQQVEQALLWSRLSAEDAAKVKAKGHLQRSPFKIGTEAAISLEREIPRNWRFANEEDEQKLLNACNPHLRAVVVAMLDTACRPGELLSLQWKDVNLSRKELAIRAEKAKTRTERLIPISKRLHAMLEMRRVGADGEELPGDAYVFGDETGAQVISVRTAWENARKRAGLEGLQLRDLRHEAGSRFEEAGVPVVYVSKLLGHSNLTTTSRYLNIHRRGLQAAMEKLEQHRPAVAQPLHNAEQNQQSATDAPTETPAANTTTSIS